jgi:hypothetical protein
VALCRAFQVFRCWHADCTCWVASPATTQGEVTMLKNILVVLGIAAITSSAFAATKAPKSPKTPIAHKLAQSDEAKPAAAKAHKKMKKEQAPVAAEKTAEPKAAEPATK